MMLSLHKNATTTPAIRAKIAASDEPASVLAGRYGVTLDTIYRWRERASFEDRSHTAHQLATTPTSAQEAVAVELRGMLLLPLDDLLAVTREFLNPDVSRSGLNRCLRRHGVSIRLDQAVFGVHIRSALTSAFAISMSLRMTTTMATFAGFPTVRRASYLALRSGLNRMATSAGM